MITNDLCLFVKKDAVLLEFMVTECNGLLHMVLFKIESV